MRGRAGKGGGETQQLSPSWRLSIFPFFTSRTSGRQPTFTPEPRRGRVAAATAAAAQLRPPPLHRPSLRWHSSRRQRLWRGLRGSFDTAGTTRTPSPATAPPSRRGQRQLQRQQQQPAALLYPPPVLSLSAASAANNAAVLLVAAGARAASQGDREAARRRYAEAGELYAQVLASREALLGPEDPAVASALFNQAALAARRGLRGEARERLQRAASVREFALGARSAELAELNAALALWLVAAASGEEGGASPPLASPPPTSLCLSRREARAHARAALAVFEELARRGEAGDAVRARHAARVAQLKGFLGL